jgi:hypothetical protein
MKTLLHFLVMAGLVPATHVLATEKTWTPSAGPGTTSGGA